MKFFIIIKNTSQRLSRKNFLKLGGVSLYQILLNKLKSEEVYVDTDSDLVLSALKGTTTNAYKRNKEFIDLENNENICISPVLLMIQNFLDKYVYDEDEIIVTPHVTSPFIKLKTILDATKFLNGEVESVSACTQHHEFAYFKSEPINFNPNIVQKTQNLEPVIMGNGAFFIFTKKTFNKYNNRIGKGHYFYPLNFPEDIEIDTRDDWKLAEAVYEKQY